MILAGMYPGAKPGFFVSGLDIAHEIVVDADVPDLAPVLNPPFSNVDPLDEPQEGRAVKLLQSGVFLNQLHPLLNIICLLLVRLQFAGQPSLLLQFLGALGLILVHQLNTDSLRDTPQHLVPRERLLRGSFTKQA